MPAPLIIATNIYKSFTIGTLTTAVLRGVSLTVHDGEFVAIMGKSGAGKSTFMYQLSVLDTPTSGSITIAGTTVTQLSEPAQTAFRLSTLGYVFQDYALVPDLTAEENIILPMLMRGDSKKAARAKARAAIDAVDLAGKYEHLPAELSGGEQQRIAIARAVADKPKILFADEPTANLDSVSGHTIIELLASLHRHGQTVVMVTHEPDYARYADRIIYMADGQIIQEETKHPSR